MIRKMEIERNLRELGSRYNRKPTNIREPYYFSKLLLIELCGWIEVSMDTIITDCANRNIKDPAIQTYTQVQIVGPTHGFSYNRHFRPMLMKVIGIVKLQELENSLDQRKFLTMKSSLGTLKTHRDQQAHSFIRGITPQAPGLTEIQNLFRNVYEGLKDLEQCLRKLKL